MLSILIPSYNYNILPLVLELKNQCDDEKILYEIIVLDDGSSITYNDNALINELENCSFSKNIENLGRASNINKLVENSKFNYLLILEADAFPVHKNYIQNYIDEIKLEKSAVFGGVLYSKIVPKSDSRLRWIYGHTREAKNLEYRLENPYDIVFTWNLLIRKDEFLKAPFNTSIKTYGFEDLVFLINLKKQSVKIDQIENECVHLNDEKSIVFLNKYNSSLKNLNFLLEAKIIESADTPLTKLYAFLRKMNLVFIVAWFFRIFKKLIIKNLTSKKPLLQLFDFYKLGYFCNLQNTPK